MAQFKTQKFTFFCSENRNFLGKRFIPAGCPVRQCCAEGHTPGDAVLEINTESRYSGMPSGFLLDIGDCRLFAGALILQRLKSCK